MRADRPTEFGLLGPAMKALLIYGYMAAMCVGYVFVAVHTPLTLYPHASHDDGLYINLGRHLAEGEWLGHYNQFTLAKGPGFPLFLAASNLLGFPESLSRALFHCAAIVFFTIVLHRFIGSVLLSGLMFTLLIWHPVSLSVFTLRVFREQIYYGQVLILLAALAVTLFGARSNKERIGCAVLAGAMWGWLWLTREEGIWILPGVALAAFAAALYGYRENRLKVVLGSLLIVAATFMTTHIAFRSVNWWVYGKFVGVEDVEPNFVSALGALNSVRSGGVVPYVSITREARQRVYAVSPAFASLSNYFEGDGGAGWARVSCEAQPSSCGEIGAAWFFFALRDAAAKAGHYKSPSSASSFYARLAREISAACERGALQCSSQMVALMPAWTWQQLTERVPELSREALDLLLLRDPPLQFNSSTGTEAALGQVLHFLNYPKHTRSVDMPSGLGSYSLRGWYYRSGNEWPSIEIKDIGGDPAPFDVHRMASPDIAEHFHDPDAVDQRFLINAHCSEACTLILTTNRGDRLEIELGKLQKGEMTLGDGRVFVDDIESAVDPAYVATRADRLAEQIRVLILEDYQWISLPVMLLGALSFVVAGLLHWRLAPWNVCYLLALVMWVSVLSRVALLMLIAATAMAALNQTYVSPAYFLLIAACILSMAACLQLNRQARASSVDVKFAGHDSGARKVEATHS